MIAERSWATKRMARPVRSSESNFVEDLDLILPCLPYIRLFLFSGLDDRGWRTLAPASPIAAIVIPAVSIATLKTVRFQVRWLSYTYIKFPILFLPCTFVYRFPQT